jgi:hypothetical protein
MIFMTQASVATILHFARLVLALSGRFYKPFWCVIDAEFGVILLRIYADCGVTYNIKVLTDWLQLPIFYKLILTINKLDRMFFARNFGPIYCSLLWASTVSLSQILD